MAVLRSPGNRMVDTQAGGRVVKTGDTTSSIRNNKLGVSVVTLTPSQKLEIQRKANAGIPLTNASPLAQQYYDSVKKTGNISNAGQQSQFGGIPGNTQSGQGSNISKPLSLDIAKGVTALQQAAAKGINSPESKSYMTLTNNKIKTEKPKPLGMSATVEGIKELFKTVFNKKSGFLLPSDSKYKNINVENEKKYLQNLYETGNEGQKDFAKRQAKLYGIQLKEPQALTQTIQPGNQSSFLGIPGITDTGEGASLVKPKQETIIPSEIIKKETPKKEDKVIKEDVDKIVGNQNNIDEDNAKKVLEDLTKEEITAVNNASSTEQKNDIMKYFNKLQDEITRRTISQLRTGKEQALLGLGQAQAAIAPQYESQRARAATTSMQQARNFSEYLAARGQSTSGLAAQAELSRGSGLTRQLGEIGQQQQATQDQLNANKAKIQSDFQLAIANAKSNAEVTKLNQALAQAMKQEDRAYSEQIYEKQKQDRLNEIRSGREWQLAFANYQNAINRGNTEEARNFQIKMFELEQQATKDLVTFRASLEPPAVEKPQDYNYKTDSNFANALQQLQSGDVEANYNDIVQNASDYIYAFGYEGYNEIKKQLEGILNRNPFLTQ